jgi:quinol monooxygenase YgiN
MHFMLHMLVIHTVGEYEKWKKVFDEDAATRKSSGSMGGRLYRSADNPNQMIVQMDWESAEKAHQFAAAPGLRESMERAGVVGMPQVFFLEEIEKIAA